MNMMQEEIIPLFELKLKTDFGEMTAVFISSAINCYQDAYTAYFKEKPSVVVQAYSVNEAVNGLYKSLDTTTKYEKRKK